jgi:putative phosphoribosyl transferase
VPIAAASTVEDLRPEIDDLVCAASPDPFESVGLWYEDFSPTTDEEVRELLDMAMMEQHEREHAGAQEGAP